MEMKTAAHRFLLNAAPSQNSPHSFSSSSTVLLLLQYEIERVKYFKTSVSVK